MLCSLRRFTRSNLFKTFRSVSTIQRSALSYIFQGSIQIECSTSSTIARLLGSSSTVMATATGNGAKCNRLAQEKSPYLQQHATNPVDWYPWGEAAFQKARQENKPIFLSVGYSTCHWCHVMERESFCDSDIGNILNHNFVSIKVDREERPDVDKMYMTFVQATSGQGGWPMSVWLTPDLKPIVGGTYFPPDDRFGRPGFRTILLNLARKWREDRDQLAQQSSRVMDALNRAMIISPPDGTSDIPNKEDILSKCHQSFVDSYDAQRGGFGNAPKFPQPVKLNLLFSSTYWFDAANQEKSDQAKCIALHTLEKMADGGIHDHVSKGFHRYSVDGEWHLPHFEKMLYDQAQLVTAYLDGYVISKEQKYADVAQDILEYVSRDLSDKCGGFYSAEDADSLPCDALDGASAVKREGAFCVWTDDEIRHLLSEQVEGRSDVTWADVFAKHYGVKKEGNVNPALDHHNELKNKNVLKVSCTLEETAQCFNLSVDTTQEILDKCKQILYEARLKRPRPHLDDKMLTSWNGLMLSAFARGGQVLQDAAFTKRAIDAAKFLHEYMYNNATQTLLRSCYVHEGKPAQLDTAIDGFADDYAFLIRGLLDLYDTCFDERWIEWAQQLQATQDQLFWDDETGGYYNTSSKDPSILLRLKEDQDGAEPSANSISTCNLVRLATLLDCAQHRERARKLVTTFTKHLTEAPHILPQMVCGLMCLHTPPQEIVLLGKESDPEIQRMLQCVRSEYLPNKVVILLGGAAGGEGDDDESFLTRSNHFLRGLAEQATASTTSSGTPSATAYVCQNYTCSLPVHDADDLKQLLLRRPAASSEAAPSASDNNPSQPSGKL